MAASGELEFALQNGFGGNLHHVITPPPQLSVLFVTVHTNVIVRCNHKNINCRSDWLGRQHSRLPRAANTLAPPLSRSVFDFLSAAVRRRRQFSSHHPSPDRTQHHGLVASRRVGSGRVVRCESGIMRLNAATRRRSALVKRSPRRDVYCRLSDVNAPSCVRWSVASASATV